MKRILVAAAVCLLAAPAFGGEVPQSTLSSLGLGEMQVLSDADGMQVRGMASFARASSNSSFSVFLHDPATGSTLNANGSSSAAAHEIKLFTNARARAFSLTGSSPLELNVNGFNASTSRIRVGGIGIGRAF